MKLLFVHQGFPGQYVHILHALEAQGGHDLVGLGMEANLTGLQKRSLLPVRTWARKPGRVKPKGTDIESKVIRAEACANAALQLKQQDLLNCLVTQAGENYFLKDIWPNVPILMYQGFSTIRVALIMTMELQQEPEWTDCECIRIKTANQLLNLESSTWNITPTEFQRSTYPEAWRNRFMMELTQTKHVQKNAESVTLQDGTTIKIVTFVNRNLEPYRGCHSMIRAIPHIQQLAPEAAYSYRNKGVSYESLALKANGAIDF